MAEAQPEMLEAVFDEIVGPPLPPVAVRAWDVFGQLSGTRSAGMGSIGAITYTELVAFQTCTGTTLTPLDVALIREADGAFLSMAMARMNRADDPPASDTSED
jgi:hypothetical protein